MEEKENGLISTKSYGTIPAAKVSNSEKPSGWGARHTFCVMAFFGLLVNFSMRVNISVAIVAMVSSGTSNNETVNIGTECPFPDSKNSESPIIKNTGEFNWSPEEQGLVLGSYYYGFIVTQIPGGILSEKFGAKWFIGLLTFCSGILTTFNPLAARNGGVGAIMGLRIFQGLVQGLIVPSIYSMISKWIPKNEKSQLFNLIWAGSPLATVVTLPLSGLLADAFGWEYVYYFFGGVAMIFSLIWAMLAHDSPSKHPRISEVEREYIENGLPTSINAGRRLPFPPWKKILTSIPVWALTFTFTGSSYVFYMIMSEIPTYLSTIQHFSLTSNGFLSALPYLLQICFSIPAAWLADGLVKKELTSIGKIRKSFALVAALGPSVCLIGLGLTNCNQALSIVWLCLAVMLSGANNSGMNMNQMELSPNYAGTLRGFTSTFGNITGFVAPLIAGAITNNNQTLEAWKIIFLSTAGLNIVSVAVFVIFGRTSVQPWNTYWEESERDGKVKPKPKKLKEES